MPNEARQQLDSSTRLYSAAQVRELDARIIDAGTPGIVLMKRAAEAVFSALRAKWPNARRLVIFCGKGNNGGDGYLVAKLAVDKGLAVEVFEVGFDASANNSDADAPLNDTTLARHALLDAGVTPRAFGQSDDVSSELVKADVIVDALLGTGLKGSPRPNAAAAIEQINVSDKPCVAVDIPSGLCSDTGNILGAAAIKAELTVTFIGRKKGMYTSVAADYVGELVFDALAVDQDPYEDHSYDAVLVDSQYVVSKLPRRAACAYKQTSGHVLVIAGDHGMSGAAALTAMAALRAGAGLVSVATRSANVNAVTACEPALMVNGVEQPQELLLLLEKATSVVIGPGLGQSEWSLSLFKELLRWLVETRSCPLVVDADALNLLVSNAELGELWQRWSSIDSANKSVPAVLTPHAGEAKRLAKAEVSDRYATVTALAQQFNSTVLLKGAGTLVANRDQTAVVPFGNPVLATAGTGDVLSGVVVAMLAQGLSSIDAATVAACLHGMAADSYAESAGPYGFTASDLPKLIASEMNTLLLADK